MGLKEELGLVKPFRHLSHEAMLGIYYTAAKAKKKGDEFFRAHGLTDVQFNVMMLLRNQSGEQGGLTQVDLSRMMLVNRANITSLIDRMEKAGLVRRESVPGDRRFNIVKMTPAGDAIFDEAAGPYMQKIKDVMDVLNEKEIKKLMSMLARIRERLGQVSAE